MKENGPELLGLFLLSAKGGGHRARRIDQIVYNTGTVRGPFCLAAHLRNAKQQRARVAASGSFG